ncbi:MAG: HlyD family efflux transporter periplasmic adaptor subunit [Alphaproteobacteria bacterium]|nr:HlyD family efflux transporter periplasmic adaptor subunit [Alphaproteobacteria bacterium]
MEWIDQAWSWVRAVTLAVLGYFAPDPPATNAFPGYVEAEYTRIAAPAPGTVVALAVARGDAVKAGALIAQLDATLELAVVAEARARLAQAQAQLADLGKGRRTPEIDALQAQRTQAEAAFKLSEAEFRRQSQLAAGGIVTVGRLDETRAAYERDRARIAELDAQIEAAQLGGRDDQVRAAQALVNALRAVQEQAEFRLSQRTLTAPMEARVVDTLYALGEFVPGAAPIVTLLPPGKMKLRFFVPEPALSGVRIGESVGVACDGCPAGLAARVTFIAPQAEYTPPVIFSRENRAKLVFLVEAAPDQKSAQDWGGLHPGLPVEVSLGRTAP